MRESWPILHRQAGEALGEVLVVLARQQRRRHDDGGLLAVDRGGEGGAQRDLGLAEADVAADQPVHRPAGAEIVERRLDGLAPDPRSRRRGTGRRTRRRAPRAATSRAAGRVSRCAAMRTSSAAMSRTRFFSRALRVCQPVDAEPVEFAGLRAVARQQFQVLDRQEQPVAAGVVDLQAIVRRARRLDGLAGRRSGRRRGRCGRRDRRPLAPRPRPARSRRGACAWPGARGGRPRMSCSPMTARSAASKPCSSATTASGSAPARAIFTCA